jgi:hypothetical protein
MTDAGAAERGRDRRAAIRAAMRRAQRAGLPLHVMALAGITARDEHRPQGCHPWPVVVRLTDDVTLVFWGGGPQ